MKRLSSEWTSFRKRVFPALWFGFIGVMFVVMLFSLTAGTGKARPPTGILLAPIVMALFGYFLMKHLIFDLVDEVEDRGDHLVVRNSGVEEQIALSDIMNVSATLMVNPPRVTLSLRRDSLFGREISFTPPKKFLGLNPFAKDPMVRDLIERIDAARGN